MAVSESLPDSELPRSETGSAARAAASGERPVRFGLAARIAVWATVLGTITAAAIAFIMYQAAVGALVEREVRGLSASVNAAALRLAARLEFAREDTLFLSRILPVAGIVRAARNAGVDPDSGIGDAEWRQRLASVFQALLESRPAYLQLRFVGVADGGREIVRVDRTPDGEIRRTPEEALQPKGDRSYFQEAARLAAGEVYVSDFELNRENGVVEVPHRPVIRTATPVFDGAGIFRGEVIVNIDAARWFDLLKETFGPDETLYVTNAAGDYLVNPDPGLTFGFDLGARHRLEDDMPALAGVPGAVDQPFAGLVVLAGRSVLTAARRVVIDPRAPQHHIVVAAVLDGDVLLHSIRAQRDTIVLVALGLILAGTVLAIVLARAIVRPLRELTAAATRMAAGERRIDVGGMMRRSDETGALAQAFDAMAREVREREHEVNAKAGELSRSNQELSQFAYIASHDLQEPLRMVGSYLGLLARRYRGRLDAEADEFIGYAVDGAARMKRLINDLLGYSRVSNRPLSREAVDTGRIVEAAVRVLAERIAAAAAEITVEPLPKVDADPLQMERLFLNLIENAVRYRGEAPPQIRVAAGRRDGFWEFSIADNGIGIAPEFKDKVFDIFARLNSREKYEGTGVGLASCRKIVERHGGSIWVEPAAGGGSVFRFTLPAIREGEED